MQYLKSLHMRRIYYVRYVYMYTSHKPEISYGWVSKEELKGAEETEGLCHPSSPDRR